ncbi:hypothetical protein P153DRAFT_362675 [Dothidotthia symphoricarpi CBS 119687]|uniref:Cora-domain-containing protein n=1 Tax=Dothidotthia symphoricarpi CBS 119687 TaxID=1392245 RepID=A0A6A6AVH7_9PLEO|nr:uncharacterized protein P153DRAFT_362675 [Dothidotthia symphoricarpi CBS 119687]KAF2134965.1 hypothetical protein P153DRAFT_362675 [Dothidotthia symphoricarpi CBS 119687]
MDWADDNACLSRSTQDLRRVFKYEQRPTIVIRIVESSNYEAQIWILETDDDWTQWLDTYFSYTGRGLVLVLANRAGGSTLCRTDRAPIGIADWLRETQGDLAHTNGFRRAETFAPLGEKHNTLRATREASLSKQPARGIRHLPFSLPTFERICERFQIHQSFIRAMTRSDVPLFSCEEVEMKRPAMVYNCRTPNAWESDLALSATYYPERGLTFAILYGVSSTIERTLLERFHSIGGEAAHPLLMPGIFAELELKRHTKIVETHINNVETMILELDVRSSDGQAHRSADMESRNRAKRTAWLDLTYLRNSLTTWSGQLLKMTEHDDQLDQQYFPPKCSECTSVALSRHSTWPQKYFQFEARMAAILNPGCTNVAEDSCNVKPEKDESDSSPSGKVGANPDPTHGSQRLQRSDNYRDSLPCAQDDCVYLEQMRTVGEKIRIRLAAIRDEYDEKIRDCTMRVDGMAMATQWSHSETAVEIALATSQDSKVMRSISLVTMVFLPGTFFATVFSMTFFDWFGDDGETQISSYVWVYVVVTVFFTTITIGLWYFFVIFRRTNRVVNDEEMIVMGRWQRISFIPMCCRMRDRLVLRCSK